ncbi:transcriptional protein SWT1 isoform X2 [Sorex araneus]|uniref:transcriptional protein SWT1 isoform X2 n=1 Tax=Sorex araneus TaxID=42254 RepID=UPI002433888B|nr:transcriptional protein SWT1 isoform X2 [Sorex araneus]
MYARDDCGKQEKTPRRGSPSLPSFCEDREKRSLARSPSPEASPRRVSGEKRKLKSDHTDLRFCPVKRRPEAKRPHVEAEDALRKRARTTAWSQGPPKHQEASHSAADPGSPQSPALSRTKKDVGGAPERRPQDPQLAPGRRKLDSKADSQAGGRRSVTREAKPERPPQAPDGPRKCCVWEKRQRAQAAAEGCPPDPPSQEPLDSTRRRVSFRIPSRAREPLGKPAEPTACRSLSEAGEGGGGAEAPRGLPKATEPQSAPASAGSVSRPAVREWTRRDDHEPRGRSQPRSGGKVSEMQIVEELHAARAGKSVDLLAGPTSGELMSMEIDLAEEDVHPSAANPASDKKLLIVIDTNILMNHLKFVKSLKTTEIPGFDGLVLIIPWVVVQELDRMKDGKLLKHVQHKAIPAVHFIHDGLREPDRKLWGQPLQLAAQRLYGLSDENSDDRVLKCCLQYQELFPRSLVILCTDDRNLRSKGLISGVKSLSKEELSAECRSPTLSTASGQPGLPEQPREAETKPSEGRPSEDAADSERVRLHEFMSQLEKSLGSALSSILETEMKLAFGDLWVEVLYLKPPWTLLHLLQCFRKHWLAVFGLAVENGLLATVESLYHNLSKANRAVDLATVKFLLQDAKTLLLAFSARSNYDGVLPQAFAHVTRLLQAFPAVKATRHPTPPVKAAGSRQGGAAPPPHSQDVAPRADPPAPPASRHQEIWSILEKVWITIYQNSTEVFQALGSDSPPASSQLASLEGAFLSLQKLMAAAKDILEGIQRILAPNSSFQDIEPLYSTLVKYEVNAHIRFTAQELYNCVSLAEYREKLAIGCGQLEDLEAAMRQCHAHVCQGARPPPTT